MSIRVKIIAVKKNLPFRRQGNWEKKLMMGEVSLETSPKNIMIQDMRNSKTV